MSKSLDLQVILAARDKITGPLKKINATTTGTARALKTAQAETKHLQKQQGDVRSYRTARAGLRSVQKSLNATQKARHSYVESLEAQRKKHDVLKTKTKEARESQRQLATQMQRTHEPSTALVRDYQLASKRLAELETKQDRSYSSIKKYKEGIRGTDKQLTSLNRENDRHNQNLEDTRKRLKEAGISTKNLGQRQRELTGRLSQANDRIQRQKKYLGQLGKADVSGKFSKMSGEVGKFGKRALLATGGAAAGIFGVANSTASLGDEIAKTSDKIGIALGPFQELRYAAERSGVSTQKFDSSLERFVKRMGEATQGTGDAKKAYEQLGLSAEELSKLTPEKSLGIVADRLSTVENQSQKVAIAAQLFGREGVAMVNMMKDGSAGLKELRKDARSTGYVLSERAARDAETFKDSLLDAQLGLAGMKNTIGAELMPAVNELMGDLSGWMKENRDQVKAFAREFGSNLKNALPIIRDLAVGVGSAAKTMGIVTTKLASMVGGFDNLGTILAGLFALKPIIAMASFGKAIVAATTAVIGLAGGMPAVAAGIKAIGAALTANPIGIVIAAIASAAYLIYKNWEPISDFFSGIWDQVKKAFDGGIAGIGKLILNWSPLGLLYKAFSGVLGWFGVDLPNTFTGFGSKMLDGLGGGIMGGLKRVGATILNWSPLGLFYKAFKGLFSWFDIDLPDTFSGFGAKILDGLVGGLMGGLKKVKDSIVNAGKSTIGWFKDTLGIKSPSRVFMGAGKDTLEGYRQGLVKQEPEALKQVSGFGKRVRQAGAGIAIGASALPAAANNIQFDSRAPVAPVSNASSAASGDTHINIYASPGQSEHEIAAQVERIMQQRDRRQATRAGSALYDRE